ncbi:secondary thiamine-phosphate synthase enzyme YjbQ [Ammonifex thiophilus]|uniref:YjbQ family protein n=1 Tax=Ammonifex thiophilus TaxID=444093 RepID=A0A3D8P486_9THEO|nr:secondary thiamine-phosphate synthase enzyme YjbQ [Ammonifex thiophilus]RDV83939.1 YjbQ family protein [Ammonifex thiophilus]
MEVISVTTRRRQELVDITSQVAKLVAEKGLKEGVVYLFCPHTTAGICINENYDPTVAEDILRKLEELVPATGPYRHAEGNADAHIKSCLVGVSQVIPVREGRLALGTWQGIFFCEFDGPRQRKVWVKLIPERT